MSCKVVEHESAQARLADLGTGGVWLAAEVDRDLLEWHYGSCEGRTSVDIHAERPDWLLFRDGCPGGEMPPHLHYLWESR
jgi:broad specificity phosphatase PhoE